MRNVPAGVEDGDYTSWRDLRTAALLAAITIEPALADHRHDAALRKNASMDAPTREHRISPPATTPASFPSHDTHHTDPGTPGIPRTPDAPLRRSATLTMWLRWMMEDTSVQHTMTRILAANRLIAPLTLIATLAMSALFFAAAPAAHAAPAPRALPAIPQLVGAKHYYMAIGDSLAFGYQPDLNWADGYSTDFADQMKASAGLSTYDNLACAGETTVSMLNGGCPYWYARKYVYTGSQMSAALSYLGSHAGQVSPVTLDIGANDLGNCYSNHVINTTCGNNALNTVRTNLPIIVSKVKAKLNGTGDFFLMNYYDPYQNEAPATLTWVQQLNAIIAQVGAQYGVRVVDVYSIYHTGSYPNGGNPYVCNWTWMCSVFNDIHANSNGYSAIASGFEAAAGY